MINVQPGEEIVRMLAELPMLMVVTDVKDGIITCAAKEKDGRLFYGGWTFDQATGAEIDEDLHWGPKYGITGSFLTPKEEK